MPEYIIITIRKKLITLRELISLGMNQKNGSIFRIIISVEPVLYENFFEVFQTHQACFIPAVNNNNMLACLLNQSCL
jgi:hypothetical protein